ncbi:MAG TPA: serine hydrolase [Longimicrobiales bacterium]
MDFTRTLALCLLLVAPASLHAQTPDPEPDLVGLWKAKKRFGPDARGQLIVTRGATGYTADMMGFTIPVTARDGELTFELPNRQGGFRGQLQTGGSIRGIWFQVPTGELGAAVAVTLAPAGANRWSGNVVPLDDQQTFFLLIKRKPDGSLGAMLRNPERDYGAALGVRGFTRNGTQVSLIGGRTPRDTVITTGTYDTARSVITFNFPFRGGHYDFGRDDDEHSEFYPRARTPRYVYRVPPALGDGWETASVSDVGIDRAAIERTVQQLIDMSMDTINAPQVHSLLIARKGKLVLEEYFHGEDRTKLHNTRSGSKSITSVLAGAAMHAGMPVRLDAPVYQVMNDGAFPADLEPRKRALTLEHLLTMSSGYFCDDNNDNAPGNENNMWNQTEQPDFYRMALGLPMAFAPGEKAIYCSINTNLALGVVGRATRESPFYLFERLVAAPLGIQRYVWAMDRARNPYGGGGMGLQTRDYMKFGQLMLDSGTWKGKRIVSREFVARATSTLHQINGTRPYGLAWWREEKPYQNGTARGYAMLGAGGNIVVVFPELELVVATTGGSYISRGWRYPGGELIPNFILPAVR